MSEKPTKRGAMLSVIYQLLPNIEDDYAAKLVCAFENTKELSALQKDITDLLVHVGHSAPKSDTLIARVLLDEIPLSAALLQLRIYDNVLSIVELTHALHLSEPDAEILLNYYASLGARYFFDTEFSSALNEIRSQNQLSATQKAQHAVQVLLSRAKQDIKEHPKRTTDNQNAIYKVADKYHFSLALTAALIGAYAIPGATEFAPLFQATLDPLKEIDSNEPLLASLAAKILLCELTPKDAQQIALTSKLVKGQILEEDLQLIACRYLKHKTPQDIADTFDAVLTRLPHVNHKEENISLAVQVLLDGTEPVFEQAQAHAAYKKDRTLLYQALTRKTIFNGYEKQLAEYFAGKETIDHIEQSAQEILEKLPYVHNRTENHGLVCQVLLGVITQDEALRQANSRCNAQASDLTEELAPKVLVQYTGTKPVQKLIAFFNESLSPYSFWRKDPVAHEYALQTLVEQLNDTVPAHIVAFVLDMLENGSSVELVQDMRKNIQKNNTSPEELRGLLSMYKQARAASKDPNQKNV